MNQEDQKTPWYVVHARPWRELLVATLLEEHAELNVFLPEVLKPVRGIKKRVPLFPGYLFVQVNLERSPVGRIVQTPGVIRLLGNEREPLPVAIEVVHRLRERVSEVNERGGLLPHAFREGDAVVFKSGPLQGLDAVFVGPMEPAARVQVLLQFLGQEQQMEVEVGLLEKANPSLQTTRHRRPRRTQGKGGASMGEMLLLTAPA